MDELEEVTARQAAGRRKGSFSGLRS